MGRKPRAEYDIHANDASDAGWRSALNRADAQGRKLKSTIGAAFGGIVGVSTFTSQISKAIEFGDEIGKLSVKFGATAEATQELVAVARQFDVEIGSLSSSLKTMQIAISQASTGNKELVTTFKALGLDIERIRRLQPDQQFEVFADAISRLKDPTDRARAATAIFGRAGADLLPLFERGAEGIRKARMEVREFGQILSDFEVKKLQEADDAIKKLGATWDTFWRKVAVGTVRYGEMIGGAADKLADFATQQGRLATGARLAFMTTPIIGPLLAGAEAVAAGEAANDFSRGGGPRRGRSPRAARPPGFGTGEPPPIADAFTSEMRAAIRSAEVWRATVGEADESTRKWLEQTMDLTDELQDLPEPILELSESLIQADELQKEFTRSMFQNVSDLFMAAGKGGDEFADALLNSFKRILADRATLELFNLLGAFGSSLTGSSGGKGFAGFIGAGLTSLFGGFKAEGGPLQSGKWYVAGERGPEPIWGGGSGAYAMGYGKGGGTTFAPVYNIDARGATPDAIKLLPEIMKRNNEALEARIVQRLRSGRYG